ncbi:hypothetical protein CFC21_030452 [Triticum aestivum]|uniref:NAC domain-containing protein n=2 Tax=Triticum aestivum TaxID=4565 RepID=A0A9R1EV07_WHEAT|nr:hypothetical protein CFC21_030452 [Triticum aestivum]
MANPNLTAGYVFQPTGRELIHHYLVPRAGLGGGIFPGFIEEGVDVLSLPPRELPFRENHVRDYGEVWGFFFAAKPAGETCPTPGAGGCWVQYGTEKAYYGGEGGREAVAFRRRDAAAFRRAHPDPEAADVVFVVHKVYRKPVLPPPADSSSSDSEEEGSERSIVLKKRR